MSNTAPSIDPKDANFQKFGSKMKNLFSTLKLIFVIFEPNLNKDHPDRKYRTLKDRAKSDELPDETKDQTHHVMAQRAYPKCRQPK